MVAAAATINFGFVQKVEELEAENVALQVENGQKVIEYDQRIFNLMQTNRRLQLLPDRVQELETELAEVRRIDEEARAQIVDLGTQLRRKEGVIEAMRIDRATQKRELEARIGALEEQLENQNATLHGKAEELEALQREYRTQKRELETRIGTLDEQLENQNATLQGKTEELEALQREYGTQKDQLEAQIRDVQLQAEASDEELLSDFELEPEGADQNETRIADLETQLESRSQEKEAALELSRHFQNRAEELEMVEVILRTQIARNAIRHDHILFQAQRANRILQDQLNGINHQNNGRIAELEEQLVHETEEREQLKDLIDDLEHQLEVNQNGAGDVQHRLDATNERIQRLNEQIVQERVRVNKAVELSYLYLRFYGAKGKVKALKDCQTGLIVWGKIIGALLGALFGPISLFFGLLTGGEITSAALHILNAPKVRSLESLRKRLCSDISEIHQRLAVGAIHSELYGSFWRDLKV